MAAAKISEHLSTLITCSVCFEEFEGRDPRSLPCLHIFCRPCIQRILDANEGRCSDRTKVINCPICNSPAKIQEGSASNLPPFFYVGSVHEAVSSLRKNYDTCKICKETKVTSYCFPCKVAMCVTCKNKHDKCYANHPQVSVNESTVKCLLCLDHEDYVDSFCVDCITPVCNACVLLKHGNHQIAQLTNNTNLSSRTDEASKLLSENYQLNNELLQKVLHFHEEFNKDMKETKDDLDKHHAQMISELNKQHSSLSTEIEDRLVMVNCDLIDLMVSINENLESIENLQKRIHTLLRPVPDVPDVTLNCIEELLSETVQQNPATSYSFSKPDGLTFFSRPNSVPGVTLNCIEEVLSETVQQNPATSYSFSKPDGLTFFSGPKSVSLGELRKSEIQTSQHPESCETSHESEQEFEDSVSSSDSEVPTLVWSGPTGVSDVTFLPDGVILVVRFSKLRTLDSDGHYIHHPIIDLHKGYASRVAVDHKTSSIAVISYKKPNYDGYLDLYENNGVEWLHSCNEICQHPTSVSFTNEADIIVGDESGYLYMYDTDGDQQWKRKLSSEATCIAVNQQNEILVGHDNKMVAYHIQGNKLFTIQSSDGRDVDVTGISLQSNDEIVLGNLETNTIYLYDSNGDCIREILTLQGNLDCIAMFEDKRLAVVVSRRLYLYDV